MIVYAELDANGSLTGGWWANPQTDAIDGAGNMVKARPTKAIDDQDPALLAAAAARDAAPPADPIAALTQQVADLTAALVAKSVVAQADISAEAVQLGAAQQVKS